MSDESTHDEMERLLDQQIVETLKHGEVLKKGNGDVILDDEGKPMRATPSAAFLNMVVNRVKSRKAKPTDNNTGLEDFIRKVGGKLPKVNVDDQDAAGGGV